MIEVERSSKKKGAPPCGLYLKIKKSGNGFALIENLKKICLAINSSQYEHNMGAFEYIGKVVTEKDKDYVVLLKEMLKAQGMIFIIKDDFKLAHEIGADGVIVKDFEEAKKARKILGDDGIVGVRLGSSRKKVAQALEENIDYISLSLTPKNSKAVLDLVNWWAVRSDRLCLVEGDITNNECKALVYSGAAFVESTNYVFKHKSGVLQAVVNMAHAIDLAVEDIESNTTIH